MSDSVSAFLPQAKTSARERFSRPRNPWRVLAVHGLLADAPLRLRDGVHDAWDVKTAAHPTLLGYSCVTTWAFYFFYCRVCTYCRRNSLLVCTCCYCGVVVEEGVWVFELYSSTREVLEYLCVLPEVSNYSPGWTAVLHHGVGLRHIGEVFNSGRRSSHHVMDNLPKTASLDSSASLKGCFVDYNLPNVVLSDLPFCRVQVAFEIYEV